MFDPISCLKKISAHGKKIFPKAVSHQRNSGTAASANGGSKWSESGDRHFTRIFITILIFILILAIILSLIHFNKVTARNIEELYQPVY